MRMLASVGDEGKSLVVEPLRVYVLYPRRSLHRVQCERVFSHRAHCRHALVQQWPRTTRVAALRKLRFSIDTGPTHSYQDCVGFLSYSFFIFFIYWSLLLTSFAYLVGKQSINEFEFVNKENSSAGLFKDIKEMRIAQNGQQ